MTTSPNPIVAAIAEAESAWSSLAAAVEANDRQAVASAATKISRLGPELERLFKGDARMGGATSAAWLMGAAAEKLSQDAVSGTLEEVEAGCVFVLSFLDRVRAAAAAS
jgi:hypothetical protein